MSARLRGVEEGIDHGTVKGARQHAVRHVPICPPCTEAFEVSKSAGHPDDNRSANRTFNKDNDGKQRLLSVQALEPIELRRGARIAAALAADADDLRPLLDALGLTAAQGKAEIPEDAHSIYSSTPRKGD